MIILKYAFEKLKKVSLNFLDGLLHKNLFVCMEADVKKQHNLFNITTLVNQLSEFGVVLPIECLK